MPDSIVQNNLGGVDERALPTGSVGFNRLLGLYPKEVGMVQKVSGKVLLDKYDKPIFSIYQAWTPYGYPVGFLQFEDELNLFPWLVDPWNINLDEFGFPIIPVVIPNAILQIPSGTGTGNSDIPAPAPSGFDGGRRTAPFWEQNTSEISLSPTDGGYFFLNEIEETIESLIPFSDPPVYHTFDFETLPAFPSGVQVLGQPFTGISLDVEVETSRYSGPAFIPPDPANTIGRIHLDTKNKAAIHKGIINLADYFTLPDPSIYQICLKVDYTVEGKTPYSLTIPLDIDTPVVTINPYDYLPPQFVQTTCTNYNGDGSQVVCGNPAGTFGSAVRVKRARVQIVINSLVVIELIRHRGQ